MSEEILKTEDYVDKKHIEEKFMNMENELAKKHENFGDNDALMMYSSFANYSRKYKEGHNPEDFNNILYCSKCKEFSKMENNNDIIEKTQTCPSCDAKIEDEDLIKFYQTLSSGNIKRAEELVEHERINPFRDRFSILRYSIIYDRNKQEFKIVFGTRFIIEIDYMENYILHYSPIKDKLTLYNRESTVDWKQVRKRATISNSVGGMYDFLSKQVMIHNEKDNFSLYGMMIKKIDNSWYVKNPENNINIIEYICSTPVLDKIQSLTVIGLEKLAKDIFVEFRNKQNSESYENVLYIKRKFGIDLRETKVMKMLGVDKQLLALMVEENIGANNLTELKVLYNKINNNIKMLKQTFEVIKVEQIVNFNNFIDNLYKFNYILDDLSEYKPIKLAFYLARKTRDYQGIESVVTSLQLLYDYVRISKALEVKPFVYPSSLKREHDLASFNHKVIIDEAMTENFTKSVEQEEYKELKLEDKEYSIVVPEKPEELRIEGGMLSHCVGQYIKDVIDRSTMVVFLRKTREITTPFYTIEVKRGRVWQVQGKSGARPKGTELDFLRKWMEENKLQGNF